MSPEPLAPHHGTPLGGITRRRGWRHGWLGCSAAAVLDLVFPPTCACCGCGLASANPTLCEVCLRELTRQPAARCPRCGSTVPPALAGRSYCGRCQGRPYRFDSVWALGEYRGLLRDAVIRMKKTRHEPLTVAVAGLVVAGWTRAFDASLAGRVIVPMPMYWVRRAVRGVNCAEILAEVVARETGSTMVPRVLKYRRATRKQGTLTAGQRLVNVRGAFWARRSRRLLGQRILLVDDVLTTGATASEAARALRQAGAARVDVLVVARGLGVAS